MTLNDAIALIESSFAPTDAYDLITSTIYEYSESPFDFLPPSFAQYLLPAIIALNLFSADRHSNRPNMIISPDDCESLIPYDICPIHACDIEICNDDDDAECALYRSTL